MDEFERIIPSQAELIEIPQSTYTCNICQTTVRTKANLKVHMIKTHRIIQSASDVAFYSKKKCTVKKIYHCYLPDCKYNVKYSKGFSKFSALRQHYQWVHQEKVYACVQCGRTFPTPNHLAAHSKKCGQLHFCPQCDRRYTDRKYLLSHMRSAKHEWPDGETLTPTRIRSSTMTNGAGARGDTGARCPLTKASHGHPPCTVPHSKLEQFRPPRSTAVAVQKEQPAEVRILQPVYLSIMVPVSSAETARESAVAALEPILARFGSTQATQSVLSDFPPIVSDFSVKRQNSVATQTDELMLHSDEHLQFPPAVSSMGVSTDLILGLGGLEELLNGTGYLHSQGSQVQQSQETQVPQLHSASTFTGTPLTEAFDYAAFNSTAMQTDSLLGPYLHVETQTWPKYSSATDIDDHFNFQNLETQTVNFESLLFPSNAETQTGYPY